MRGDTSSKATHGNCSTNPVRPVRFVQDNESRSSYGVLRGSISSAEEHAQGKLVRVVEGAVLDVAVDIRRGSPTFRTVRGRRAFGERTTASCSSPRLRARLRRTAAPRAFPVQMRCALRAAERRGDRLERPADRYRLAARLGTCSSRKRTAAIRDWMRRPNCSTITRIYAQR